MYPSIFREYVDTDNINKEYDRGGTTEIVKESIKNMLTVERIQEIIELVKEGKVNGVMIENVIVEKHGNDIVITIKY